MRIQREESSRTLPHQHSSHSHHHSHHGGGRAHPYVLPWEDTTPEEGPPPDYASIPAKYGGEAPEEIFGGNEGRRSRTNRRSTSGETGEWQNVDRVGPAHGFTATGGTGKASRTNSSTAAMPQPYSSCPPSTVVGPNSVAARYGASAGTGGSEEWPSTQSWGLRGSLKEAPDCDDDKGSHWVAPGSGTLPWRKAGRQPAPLGSQARRSPELVDPWPPAAPSSLDGQSRVPSRLAASTPTPRDEDTLDMATRQLHGIAGRCLGSSTAAGDWQGFSPPVGAGPTPSPSGGTSDHGLGGPPSPNNSAGTVIRCRAGSLRDGRASLHEMPRMPQQPPMIPEAKSVALSPAVKSGGLCSLSRRPDLYHGPEVPPRR